MTEIRQYQNSDLESLKQLIRELQTFEQQFDAGRVEPTDESVTHYVAHLLNNVKEKQGSILVAAAGDQVCGLVAGYPEEELDFRDTYFYIAELVVSESYRGQGIGTALLRAMEDVARVKGSKRLGISALVANTLAHNLYRKVGFGDYVIELIKEL